MKLYALLFTVMVAHCQTISWQKVYTSPNTGNVGFYANGYHDIHYESLTKKVWIYSTSTANGSYSIYSTRLSSFDPATNTVSLLFDDGQPSSGPCLPDTLTWPGTRHPVGQIWVDEIRNRLWLMEGVCNTFMLADQYFFQFTDPPDGHTNWTEVFPVHLPKSATGLGIFNNAVVSHDTAHDVFLLFGYDNSAGRHSLQVYCDSNGTGILTSGQMSHGCQYPDDWTDITSQSLGGNVFVSPGYIPSGYYYPSMVFLASADSFLMFGGSKGCCSPQSLTWLYNPTTKTWTNKGPANPPAIDSANAEHIRIPYALNTTDGKFYYHQTGHAAYMMPPSHPPQDWAYDPAANTWTQLSVGQGPGLADSMTYVPELNALVVMALHETPAGIYTASGLTDIWVGTIH